MRSRWPGAFWTALWLALVCSQAALPQGVVISEFLASNGGATLDEDGDSSDWIEIHNPTTQAVDLSGWRLTDDPAAPGKWTFPTRTLGPGEFLLVWASGKDRRAAGPLHTNFRLDALGEYLALRSPASAIPTSEFAPRFPVQETDISYGTPSGANTIDLLAKAPVWMLIPTSADALPSNWAAPGPNPGTGWSLSNGMGLGFDEAPSGPGADVNLAPEGTAGQSTTGYNLGPEFGNDGSPGTFTHTASNDNASRWWVDLESSTEVQRIVLRNRDSCCPSRLRDITVQLIGDDLTTVVWSSGLLNPENILGSPASITVDLFDLNVGPVAARRVLVSRTPDPDLSGSGGSGNEDEDNVLSLGEVEVYGVGSVSLAPLIRTDLTVAMKGRSPSLFVRVPFVLNDLTDLDSLRLELLYDDGVVTYLNGQAVANWNAPAVPLWNSTATAVRGRTNALKPEWVELGPSTLRVPGTNWLAFQGLNVSAADPTFLLSARLLATAQAPVLAAYLDRPTPGATNTSTWNYGRVADTRFSVDRGVYSEPFDLVITTATPEARIWYTLDGSEPAPNQGQEYTGPIRISTTTVVRAAAFKEGFRPTGVDTQTYLFPESVIAQPARPAGFPTAWAGVTADYAMDPRITQAPAWAPGMEASLRSLPSLSISTPNDNLFGSTRGIYANPERSGVEWERPVSLEWIRPDGTGEFQVDCGLRIQGGYFRQRNVTQKHSLRLLFKDIYGPGRLRTDLFREFGAAREFDTLVLRAGANDGYAWNDARDTEQFIRDEFGRRSLLEMGQPTARGRFVHLYLNGLYWGVYNLTERPAEDFSSTYLGGEPEDWDAINSGDVKNGSLDAWNTFINSARTATTLTDYQRLKGLNADGSRNPALPEYLDAPNYIDYMLVNIWGGNWDWPNKNFWFGRHRGGLAGGFKFYLWDFENTMGNNRGRSPLNMVSPRAGITDAWVAAPHDRLRRLAEYRMEFADRVQRHFFNGGVLSPESTRRRYQALADGIEPAILAETARWGDDNWSIPQDITDWRRERDWILNTYLPQRTGIVLSQLRASGLYPQTAAPGLTPFGGPVTRTTPIVLSTTASELLYTTNGLDPRLPGGEVRPGAVRVVFDGGGGGTGPDPLLIRAGAEWRYRAVGPDPGANWNQLNFDDAGWSTGLAPLGYGDGDEATVVEFVDADPATAGMQRNATTLFRRKFNVTDPAAFSALTLTVTYDDAAAVYLNGVEILRTDNLPAGAPLTAYASGASSDNAVASRDALPATLLRAGDNVVAVEIRQSDAGSSDISFELALSGTLTGTGGGTTHQADPIQLAQPGWIRARSRQGTEWSALVEAYFTTDRVPATSNHLVLSEFCYRPADAATDAERAVTTDRDDFEYVEILNASPLAVDLTGVRFTAGILFNFPNGAALGPGERAVVVRNPAAFAARFGTAVTPLGSYDGNLANSGEELVLTDAAGQTIRRFTYLDRAPWPPSANRNGFSLALVRPDVRTDHADPSQWRASVQPGGTPGSSDSQRFAGTPGADLNGNGQDDLLDHALGSRLSDPESGLQVSVEPLLENGVLTERLVVTLPRNLAADDTTVVLESSSVLGDLWTGVGFQLLREERPLSGPIRQSFVSTRPVSESDSRFVRVRVLLNP